MAGHGPDPAMARHRRHGLPVHRQVTGAEALGEADGAERHDVYIHLEGNFPGGQVDLTDRFVLRDGRIASLEIVPTEAAQ